MKLKGPHLWIGVFSAIGVVSMAIVDTRRASPGELSAVHRNVLDETGRNGCADCHGGWTRSMTSACLDCHDVISDQMDGGRGLHGVLDEHKAKKCALCHSDHHGEGFALVNRQSFRQAGVPDPAEFDHGRIGFTMTGQHLEVGCDECHVNADVPLLPEGEHRFLGLDQNCAACHDDPHEGQMKLACAECHGQETWDGLASSGHDRFLQLVGGHAEMNCRECHAEEESHSLELLGSGKQPDARSCRACHESPHRRPFIRKLARVEDLAPEASCIACHEPEHTSFREESIDVTAERHACSGFELSTPHAEVSCDECHASEQGAFSQRYPGRKADDCAACHEDPHGDQFTQGQSSPDGCVSCHDLERFVPHAFTLEKHARTSFELTGSHVDTECAACHELPGPGEPRVFHGTEARCDDCHGDAHQGFFEEGVTSGTIEAAVDALAEETGECAVCHLTTSFSDIPEGSFDHSLWTAFVVGGAHAQADCESCHVRTEDADEHGRTFGRVEEHFGGFEGCVTCHADPHEGQFNRRKYPREIDGQTGCARCHVDVSFRTFPDGFDHGRWTGFGLDGAHAETGCSSCHEPLSVPDASGRTWERARGRECAACHADPHEGQFGESGALRNRCERCHESAEGFGRLSFNHERNSRFRLGDAHVDLECAACHKTRERDDGTEFVRYRPMRRECADCHGEHDDPLRRR
jgi:hypothetical protein